MIYWRIIAGLVLLLFSSFITDAVFDHTSAQLLIDGKDYASVIVNKFLDALGGSLALWGFLKNPKR